MTFATNQNAPARRLPAVCLTAICFAVVSCAAAGLAFGESHGEPGGKWPTSWPKELEPLRKNAWTWWSGRSLCPEYHLEFQSREEFEAAWPHIVSLRSKQAPLTLLRGPKLRIWDTKPPRGKVAGVIILGPCKNHKKGSSSWTRIALVVDGRIIDLNRFPLPDDTTVNDRRFPDASQGAQSP